MNALKCGQIWYLILFMVLIIPSKLAPWSQRTLPCDSGEPCAPHSATWQAC